MTIMANFAINLVLERSDFWRLQSLAFGSFSKRLGAQDLYCVVVELKVLSEVLSMHPWTSLFKHWLNSLSSALLTKYAIAHSCLADKWGVEWGWVLLGVSWLIPPESNSNKGLVARGKDYSLRRRVLWSSELGPSQAVCSAWMESNVEFWKVSCLGLFLAFQTFIPLAIGWGKLSGLERYTQHDTSNLSGSCLRRSWKNRVSGERGTFGSSPLNVS